MSKRIKRVFGSNAQLAHVWAQQKQDEGEGNSMFFNGAKIYSFGSHYTAAMFHGDTVLINSNRYSNCTGRHLNYISSAVKHKQSFDVPDVCNPKSGINVLYLSNEISDAITRMIYGRGNKHGTGSKWEFQRFTELTKEFNAYCSAFGIKDRLELPDDFTDDLRALCKAKDDRATAIFAPKKAEADRLRAIADAEYEAKQQASLDAWMRGEDARYYGNKTLLRIHGDKVQTTQGAEVKLEDAMELLRRMRAGENVKGFTVGDFTVDKLTKDKIIIGCHEIPLSEVNRVFA